jgi:hypothetical protein
MEEMKTKVFDRGIKIKDFPKKGGREKNTELGQKREEALT